ncbi:MAG: tetratricopeptide repeat protein, partial [Planctomycetaceae bacterium]
QTLRSFYPSKATYTAHLRALEAYRSKNKRDAASRFLLGYHYMMLGHSDAAAGELLIAVELEPRDKLSAELLAAISKKTGKPYKPKVALGSGGRVPPKLPSELPPVPPLPEDNRPAAAKKPVAGPAAAFTGSWKSTQPDGTAVTLKLLPGGKFRWTAAKGGRSTTLQGTFTLVKDHLKLTSSRGGQVLEGELLSQSKNAFQWKLKFQDADAAGLTFKRQ